MSMLIDAEIVNAIVLAAVLEADLGLHARLTHRPPCRSLVIVQSQPEVGMYRFTASGIAVFERIG